MGMLTTEMGATLDWFPSLKAVIGWSSDEMRAHRWQSLGYSLNPSSPELLSLTFRFAGDKVYPPNGTYENEPTLIQSIPSTGGPVARVEFCSNSAGQIHALAFRSKDQQLIASTEEMQPNDLPHCRLDMAPDERVFAVKATHIRNSLTSVTFLLCRDGGESENFTGNLLASEYIPEEKKEHRQATTQLDPSPKSQPG